MQENKQAPFFARVPKNSLQKSYATLPPLPVNRPGRVNIKTSNNRKTLNQYTEQITHILDSITDGFFMLDKDFKITLWNQKAGKLLGRPARAQADRAAYNGCTP